MTMTPAYAMNPANQGSHKRACHKCSKQFTVTNSRLEKSHYELNVIGATKSLTMRDVAVAQKRVCL